MEPVETGKGRRRRIDAAVKHTSQCIVFVAQTESVPNLMGYDFLNGSTDGNHIGRIAEGVAGHDSQGPDRDGIRNEPDNLVITIRGAAARLEVRQSLPK